MALFENYEGRMPQLQPVLEKYGFADLDELKAYNNSKGVDAYKIVEGIQPICFENAKWAYELGAAIALKKGVKTAAEAATLHRRGSAGVLHPRFRCRPASGWSGPRQPGRDAAGREDRVLLRSWLATSPSPLRRARSVLPATPTRFARSPCA